MMTTEAPQESIFVALDPAGHQFASQFASEQRTVERGKQVYLKTLAVYALHTYLRWVGIESKLEESQSWNPSLRFLLDTADLMLPEYGCLECCLIAPGTMSFQVSPEILMDRIGYVAVQLDADLNHAFLLGFTASIPDVEELPVSHFQSMDTLFDRLEALSVAQAVEVVPAPSPLQIRHWLDGVLESGWQALTSWIEPAPDFQLAYAFRSRNPRSASGFLSSTDEGGAVDPDFGASLTGLIQLLQFAEDDQVRCFAAQMLGRIGKGNSQVITALTEILTSLQDDSDLRWHIALSLGQVEPKNPLAAIAQCRMIDLGLDLSGHPLKLIVAILPEENGDINVLLRVLPTESEVLLPSGLELAVLDERGVIPDRCQAIAREADRLIALSFTVELHERFRVRIALGEAIYTEEFIG